MNRHHKKTSTKLICMLILCVALVGLFFLSINLGSIKVGFWQLCKGLWFVYDADVATIYDLRFPRIIIAILAGGALSVSGTLLQAVLKNPLADPGMIGVSSGAQLTTVLLAAFFPQLYAMSPFFSFLGGMLAYFFVYSLARRNGFSSLHIILVGIAVQALCTGLSNALNSFSGAGNSTVASIVSGTITMKVWSDVHMLLLFVVPGFILAILCAGWCNLLALEDKTVRGLGMQVERMQLGISLVAVLLASSCTAIVGVVGFLGLLVPHIGRLFVGNDHRFLIPFSMLLGAFIYLGADTLGRTVAYPYEISASVLMSVIGGPTFLVLLQRSAIRHGK